MPRPQRLVKSDLSLTIAELRRSLGHTQQSWAHLLGMSVGTVARWELNCRPKRTMLRRLIDLAQDRMDLVLILYAAYRREFGAAPDIEAATKAFGHLLAGFRALLEMPIQKNERQSEAEWAKEFILGQLRAAHDQLVYFSMDLETVKQIIDEQISKFFAGRNEFKTDKEKQ